MAEPVTYPSPVTVAAVSAKPVTAPAVTALTVNVSVTVPEHLPSTRVRRRRQVSGKLSWRDSVRNVSGFACSCRRTWASSLRSAAIPRSASRFVVCGAVAASCR
eukprot:1942990-Rhodomonas_salina.1